jgi:uncharacterized cupin superfamily protein
VSDPRFDNAVSRFWDAVARGEPAGSGDLDPALAETVRRLHAADDAPGPDPTYARRLREDLMHATTLPVPLDPTRHPMSNGRAAPRPAWRPALPPTKGRRRGALAQLATAALLLLTLAGVYASFVRPRPADDRPAVVPAAVASPDASPAAGGPEVLLRTALLPDRGAGGIELDFWRGAIAPGGRVNSLPEWAAQPGVHVDLVLAGTMVVRADAPIEVVRAGAAGAPETVPAGTEVTLDVGDAAIVPFASAREYHNPGEAWVELLGAFVLPEPWAPVDLIAPNYVVRPGNLYGTVPAEDLPAGPLLLTFGRVVGDAAAGAPTKLAQHGSVEWRVPEPHGAGTPPAGETSRVAYVLTLVPMDDLLLEAMLGEDDTLPEPFNLQLWFGSIPPGGRVAVAADYFRDAPATNVEYVLEGALAVRVDGPLRVVRAGQGGPTSPPESIPPGTEVVLAAGDAAVFPLETAFELVNPGQTPVRLLGAGVLSTDFTPVAPGYVFGPYAFGQYAALPPGPIKLTIRRATLVPGAVAPAPAAGELQATLAESPQSGAGLARRADGALENQGQEVVVVYVLALHPTGQGAGTPTGGMEAGTPAP